MTYRKGRSQQPVLTLHESGHLLELWDTVRSEDTVILQYLEYAAVLGTGVLGHQFQDSVEHGCPRGDLLSGVFYARNGIATVMG
jgi:hypothetical protein